MAYSEKFFQEYIIKYPNLKNILWTGSTNAIIESINTKINSFYLDLNSQAKLENTLTQKRVTESIVLDHLVYKRVKEKKDDKGIKLYLEKVLETAHTNKDIYLVYNFLPFTLEPKLLFPYLDEYHQTILNNIIHYKQIVENKIGKIISQEYDSTKQDNIIFFDTNQFLTEKTYIKYLLTNLPTTNKEIKQRQKEFFLLKLEKIFSDCLVNNEGKLVTKDNKFPNLINLNIPPLLIQYITKYIAYDTLEGIYYDDFATNKELISQDIQFIYCAQVNGGYANYNNKTLNFSPLNSQAVETESILYFLKAAAHEARHAIQDNAHKSNNSIIRNCHFEYIVKKIETGEEYQNNYNSEVIEFDSNRFAMWKVKNYFEAINRKDILPNLKESTELSFSFSYETLKAAILFLKTRYADTSNETIWKNQFERLNSHIKEYINKYPELQFFYETKDNKVINKTLLNIFTKQNLYLKHDVNPFSSTFTLNYIRYRFELGDFTELINYLKNNKVEKNTPLIDNIIGLLYTLHTEINELKVNTPLLISKWSYTVKENNKELHQKILPSYLIRIESELSIINKLREVSKKYPTIEEKILLIEKEYLTLLNIIKIQLDNIINLSNTTTDIKKYKLLVRDSLRILEILLGLKKVFTNYQNNIINTTIKTLLENNIKINNELIERANILFTLDNLDSIKTINNKKETLLQEYNKSM